MPKYLMAYTAAAVVLVALDLLWIGLIAKPLYLQGIGHLMLDQPRLAVAALFYLVFTGGLLLFAIVPQAGVPGVRGTALQAALFGLFCYATYDLTNLATLRGWPVHIVVVDIAWGAVISALAAAASLALLQRRRGSSPR